MKNLLCRLLSVLLIVVLCVLDLSAQDKKLVTGSVKDAAGIGPGKSGAGANLVLTRPR